jgi:hypothetical protein
MHNSIAIELLKGLSKEELRLLKDLIASPFFNRNKTLIRLFEIISDCAPGYTSRALERKKLFRKLYPGREFNEGTLKTRMSELVSLIKEFILQKGLKEKRLERKLWLSEELSKRKFFGMAEKQLNEASEEINESGAPDTDFFRKNLEILSQKHALYLAQDMKKETYMLSIERGEYLINYSLNMIMQIMNDIEITGMEAQVKPEIEIGKLFSENFNIKEFLSALEKKEYKYYPVLAVSYYGYASFLEPGNEEVFFKLKELVFEYHESISKKELYNFWSILSNSAFLNYLSKGVKFAEHSHEINKFFLERNVLPASGQFPPLLYQNAILNAIIVKDTEWAESFAASYKEKLVPGTSESRYSYVMALIEFEKRNFNRSLEYAISIRFNDVFDKVNTRMVVIKNYYELGHWEQVFSMLDSLKHFINESKELPEYNVVRLQKMAKYMGKLTAARADGKKLDYADFKEAEKEKPFQISEWILEKMKELV